MPHIKKNIFETPCTEKWETMTGSGCIKRCDLCIRQVHDVSGLDIKTVAKDYVNADKCVQMDADQVDFFKYLRSLKHAASISALLALTNPLATTAQTESSIEDPCTISGVIAENDKSNQRVYLYIDGEIYETRSDFTGYFTLTIPRNAQIESSNVKQLKDRKIRRKKMHIGHAKIPFVSRTIGTPAF